MQLSEHFFLREFEVSQYATRKGYDNTIPAEYLDNLRCLVSSVLQPLRNQIGISVHVSSGYRSARVNKGVGGSKNSAHLKALAADIWVVDYTPFELTQVIIDMELPYEKVIHEFGKWTHVAVPEGCTGPDRTILTAHKVGNNITRYAAGNMPVDDNRRLA